MDTTVKLYNVHLYPEIRVRVDNVAAPDQVAAIDKALDLVDIGALFQTANMRCLHSAAHVEDGEGMNTACVDEVGDVDFKNARWHNLLTQSQPSHIGKWYNRFDAIEVHECAELKDPVTGETYVEQLDHGFVAAGPVNSAKDRAFIERRFHGVFGHLKTGGLESICDCETGLDAEAIATALRLLL